MSPAVTTAALAAIITAHVRAGLAGRDATVPPEHIDAAAAEIMLALKGTLPKKESSPARVDLAFLHPIRPGENSGAWTNRLLSHAAEAGTYRQCSIGWHGDCSESGLGAAAECSCICHDPDAALYTVEGHAEGGTVTVTRVEAGRLHWPSVPGEPETAWADWVWASSPEEAKAKAREARERKA